MRISLVCARVASRRVMQRARFERTRAFATALATAAAVAAAAAAAGVTSERASERTRGNRRSARDEPKGGAPQPRRLTNSRRRARLHVCKRARARRAQNNICKRDR